MTPSTDIEKRYCGCCYCGRGWQYDGDEPSDELVKEVCEHESVCPKNPYTKRIAELESEVERLKAKLARAVEIAHRVAYTDSPDLWEELDKLDPDLWEKLDQLEATLKEPTK
jgi:uncharacterized small protein (DUF1192 family)